MFVRKVVIGKQGARIRDIGTKTRHAIENLLGKKVFLVSSKLLEISVTASRNLMKSALENKL
ncbi:MAG: KH domain-containing protein [Acidobacteriota bacterium]|nr:KH domain-containing protein [Acidobacteriota bacterium]